MEVDEIKFGSYVDKQSYVDILNYLQNNIDMKCYEYQGRKFLFFELDLKDGSTLCISGYVLAEGNERKKDTASFVVNNSEKGQVARYFESISNLIVDEKDYYKVPYFDSVKFLYNENEFQALKGNKLNVLRYYSNDIKYMVDQILCELEYKVGNIDLRVICGLAPQVRGELEKKLKNKFVDKLNSDGVWGSLFIPWLFCS